MSAPVVVGGVVLILGLAWLVVVVLIAAGALLASRPATSRADELELRRRSRLIAALTKENQR